MLTIDEWVSKIGRRTIEFSPESYSPNQDTIKCTLTMLHNGNFIVTKGYAETSGNAFEIAIEQIEKTIGTSWRQLKLC